MAVYKDQERGTWYAKFSYKDRYGDTRWTTKRGFRTPEEDSPSRRKTGIRSVPQLGNIRWY